MITVSSNDSHMSLLLQQFCSDRARIDMTCFPAPAGSDLPDGFFPTKMFEAKSEGLVFHAPFDLHEDARVFCLCTLGGNQWSFKVDVKETGVYGSNNEPVILTTLPEKICPGQERRYPRTGLRQSGDNFALLRPLKDLESATDSEKASLANHRQAAKLTNPTITLPVYNEGQIKGYIKNISQGGIAIIADDSALQTLQDNRYFWAKLQLPHIVKPIVVAVKRISAHPVGDDKLQIGFAIEHSHRPKYQGHITRLIQNVTNEIKRYN